VGARRFLRLGEYWVCVALKRLLVINAILRMPVVMFASATALLVTF